MSAAMRTLSFSPSNAAGAHTPREVTLQRFAEQLAAALASEREQHAATERALAKAKASEAAVQQTLRRLAADWRVRKQSWHTAHKKHLRVKDKYTKLLELVRAGAAKRAAAAAEQELEDDGAPTPTPAIKTPVALSMVAVDDDETTPAPPPPSAVVTPPPPQPPKRRNAEAPRGVFPPKAPPPPPATRRTRSNETPDDFWSMSMTPRSQAADMVVDSQMEAAAAFPNHHHRWRTTARTVDDPFEAAMAEHKAEQQSRGAPKVFAKRIVAVESQQINEEPAGRTSITNKRGRTKRGRKGGGGATPSLAALSIGE